MLLWQRKNMPKLAFSFRLGFLVLCMHLVAICILFKQSMGVHDELHVQLGQNYIIGADIVVVPFKKVIKEQLVSTCKPTIQAAAHSTVLKDTKKPAKPKPASKDSAPKKQIFDVKKTEPKLEKPAAPAAQAEQTIEPEKPPVENKQIMNSQAEKDVVEKKVIERSAPAEKKTESAQESVKQYIGTRQLRMLEIQQAIVEQVQMHWQPPEGFEPEAAVILSVSINSSGEITDVNTQQSSGICVYDVHARSAVYEMQFPKACWGSTVTISFN